MQQRFRTKRRHMQPQKKILNILTSFFTCIYEPTVTVYNIIPGHGTRLLLHCGDREREGEKRLKELSAAYSLFIPTELNFAQVPIFTLCFAVMTLFSVKVNFFSLTLTLKLGTRGSGMRGTLFRSDTSTHQL